MDPPETCRMMQQAPLAAVSRTLQAAAAAESLSDRESPDAGIHLHLAPIKTRSSCMHARACCGHCASSNGSFACSWRGPERKSTR